MGPRDFKSLILHVLLGMTFFEICAAQNDITLSIYSATSKSITARWTRYPGASSYRLTATPKNSPGSVFAQFSGSTVMGSLISLTQNTVYTIRVEAMNNSFTVLSTAAVEETTAPEVPTITRAFSKMSDRITVEFPSVTGASAYIVRAESVADGFFSETEVPANSAFYQATVLGLSPYTLYTLSVMSVNGISISQPSLPVEARTVVAAPQLSSMSPSNDTIMVTWPPVDHAVLYSLTIIMEGSSTRFDINTTSTVEEFNNLEAGTNYFIKANAWDPEGIPGDVITISQITRPPSPDTVQVMLATGRSMGMAIHWGNVRGADDYLALSSTGQNCTSTDTYCIISPLTCGQNHTVTVTAENQAGPSDPSQPEDFLTFPCPPEWLSLEETVPGNCTLHWDEVEWVDYYIGFMKRDDGSELYCNTTGASCSYHCDCGYTYFMTVFAYNFAGSSPPGPVINYTTVPCCPEEVSISLVSTETLEIMWAPVRGADLYETKAAGSSDLILCNDTAPVCALSDLSCDTAYSVVVTPCSEARGCNLTCMPHTRETAPCSPEILSITQSNGTSVLVTWSASNREANYTVNVVGKTGSHSCQSTGMSCEVPGLPCGSTYEVTAFARASVGLSLPSYTVPLETGPCCPQSLSVMQVTQAMSNVTWSAATGAQSYVTSLTSPRGDAKCHTLDTHCLMGCITCGTSYTVSLEAISRTGHKSECTYHGFSSSACCPTSVKLYRLSNNTIRVYWRSSGNLSNYTVDLQGAIANYTCAPLLGSSSCDVSEVVCGDVYTVVVAPLTREGTRIEFCPRRIYSVSCAGSSVGMVIYRGKRIPATSQITFSRAISSTAIRFEWSSVSGADRYFLIVEPIAGGETFNHTFTNLSGEVSNLQPSTSYNCYVYSSNVAGLGSASRVRTVTTSINAVTAISVDYSCSSGMATVTWGTVFGATSYRATATAGDGTTLSCTSVASSCQITRVACGERYLVQVTAISDDCESTSNITAFFETVPCPPTDLNTFRECSSNVIIFSWAPTNNTAYYVATALGSDGEVTECRTTETACFFTSTDCGQGYQYTVYSVSGECNSGLSPAAHVRTAPCEPQNVKTTAECQSDVLITTWDTAAGALSYTVEARGNNGDYYNCSSFTNSCAMPGVSCGESLSVWITASDDDCTSDRTLGEVAETVPCTPQNVTSVRDCGSDYITLDWEMSAGAVFYIASAVHADGTMRTCNAMATECRIEGLRCGQTYTAFVIATNFKCNSSESVRVTAETAPCPPDHIEAFLDCEANHALIVWQNHQSMGSYTAIAEDAHGGLLSCSTTSNNCIIPELKCGQQYAVSVTHHDGTCSSLPSTAIQMDSGELMVGWDVSIPGQNYTTIVSDGNGERISCNSSETHCRLSGLECGTSYMVVVFSVNGTCKSMPSSDVVFQEAPCVPTNVTAERTCGESMVTVHWEASRGALRYTAVAVGSGGHRSECSSNSTACNMADLLCGQVYTIGVVAVDDNCTSPQSQLMTLRTGREGAGTR
ncbi:fibronectin-like [Megalops cyprinoides]|uniref:fibronectin-like n=1 Tax=Megalops cyprinoides TaxID=118141 RepID=UPI001863C25E|nr:fibronectin-like [Megalops cyprinoides]